MVDELTPAQIRSKKRKLDYSMKAEEKEARTDALDAGGYYEKKEKAATERGAAVNATGIAAGLTVGLVIASAIAPPLAPLFMIGALVMGYRAVTKGLQSARHSSQARAIKKDVDRVDRGDRNDEREARIERSGGGQEQQVGTSSPERTGVQKLLDGLLDINNIGEKGDKNRDKFVDHLIKTSGFDKMTQVGQDKFLNDINSQIEDGGLQRKAGINEKEKLEINTTRPGRLDDKATRWTSALSDMATDFGINQDAKIQLAERGKSDVLGGDGPIPSTGAEEVIDTNSDKKKRDDGLIKAIAGTIKEGNVDFSDEKYKTKDAYKDNDDKTSVLAEKIYDRAGLGGEGVTGFQKGAFLKAFSAGVKVAAESSDKVDLLDDASPNKPISVSTVKDIAAGAGAELAIMPQILERGSKDGTEKGNAWRRDEDGRNKSKDLLSDDVASAVRKSVSEVREELGEKIPQESLPALPNKTKNQEPANKKVRFAEGTKNTSDRGLVPEPAVSGETLMRESTPQEAAQKTRDASRPSAALEDNAEDVTHLVRSSGKAGRVEVDGIFKNREEGRNPADEVASVSPPNSRGLKLARAVNGSGRKSEPAVTFKQSSNESRGIS